MEKTGARRAASPCANALGLQKRSTVLGLCVAQIAIAVGIPPRCLGGWSTSPVKATTGRCRVIWCQGSALGFPACLSRLSQKSTRYREASHSSRAGRCARLWRLQSVSARLVLPGACVSPLRCRLCPCVYGTTQHYLPPHLGYRRRRRRRRAGQRQPLLPTQHAGDDIVTQRAVLPGERGATLGPWRPWPGRLWPQRPVISACPP